MEETIHNNLISLMVVAVPKITTSLLKGTVSCLYDQALIEMSTNLSKPQVGVVRTWVAFLDATAKDRLISNLVPASLVCKTKKV